jgi:hypothetical protein
MDDGGRIDQCTSDCDEPSTEAAPRMTNYLENIVEKVRGRSTEYFGVDPF